MKADPYWTNTWPESIFWDKHPFKSFAELFPDHRSGTFSSDPASLNAIANRPPRPAFKPGAAELTLLKAHFPAADPTDPPWKDIRAELLVAGVAPDTIKQVDTGDLIRMLDRIRLADPKLNASADAKEAFLAMIRRVGPEPIAYLAETGWNLREWLREVSLDATLQPVLDSQLPGVRRQLEMKLLDAELSRFAPQLPKGDDLTAANLIAFIERLTLPGGATIRVPTVNLSIIERWLSLSRLRAMRIAMQLCGEDHKPLYDSTNEDDLKLIEEIDPRKLAELWNAMEEFDPFNAISNPAPVSVETHEVSTSAAPVPPAVVLSGQGQPVFVLGKQKPPLTDPQYNVVQCLWNAGEGGVNKDELVTRSGHSDARGIISRLAASDSDWDKVLGRPGKTGGRYRIRTNPH